MKEVEAGLLEDVMMSSSVMVCTVQLPPGVVLPSYYFESLGM